MGLHKTPREIVAMTVAEFETLSHYQPDAKKKKQVMGLADPEHEALQKQLAYMALTPREKIAKRLAERDQ